MLPQERIEELVLIARDEWNRSLTFDEAAELAKWLVAVYQALLQE